MANPVIQSCGFTDSATVVGGSTSLRDYFGAFVPGYSKLTFSSTFSGVTSGGSARQQLILRKNSASGERILDVAPMTAAGTTGWSLSIGAINYTGTVYYRYTIVDLSGGGSANVSGTITFMAYTPPTISAFGVTRYKYVAGQGNVPASDGNHVWVTLTASACATSGASNPATLTLQGSAVTTGSNGLSYSVTDSASLYTGSVNVSSDVQFTAIVTDKVTKVTKYTYAPADGAYFNVEKNGVAVGKRSEASASDKMFEVAQNYRALFLGNVKVNGNTSLNNTTINGTLQTSGYSTFNGHLEANGGSTFSSTESHSGDETHSGNVTFNNSVLINGNLWLNPTWVDVQTNSGISNPNPNSYGGGKLKVTKIGNHVYLTGGVSAISGNTIGTLSSSYAPGTNRYFLVACGGARICRLLIKANGEIVAEWIRNLDDGSEATANVWIDCEVDYWI